MQAIFSTLSILLQRLGIEVSVFQECFCGYLEFCVFCLLQLLRTQWLLLLVLLILPWFRIVKSGLSAIADGILKHGIL